MASKIRTFIKTVYLDVLFNRKTQDFSSHWAGTTVKGYKVLATNNEAFQLTFTADPDDGAIEGIPLNEMRVHNFNQLANNAVFENSVVQAGVFVKVLISVEDPIIDTSSKSSGGSTVIVSEGNNHSSVRVDVPNNTTTVLATADDHRSVANIQLKSGGTFWVGNPSELADPDYKNICQQVTLNVGEILQYKNVAALNCKTDSGALVFSVFKEVF